jgi:hypothetical protein
MTGGGWGNLVAMASFKELERKRKFTRRLNHISRLRFEP